MSDSIGELGRIKLQRIPPFIIIHVDINLECAIGQASDDVIL